MSRKAAAGPFCQFPPNARFNVFVNLDWYRLTLRPDQILSVESSYPTDEGFAGRGEVWSYLSDDLVVTNDIATWGRDCDGPHETDAAYACPVADLRAIPAEEDEYQFPRPARPNWSILRSFQRDHYAEAAGY